MRVILCHLGSECLDAVQVCQVQQCVLELVPTLCKAMKNKPQSSQLFDRKLEQLQWHSLGYTAVVPARGPLGDCMLQSECLTASALPSWLVAKMA